MAHCAQCGKEIGTALVCVHCGALNAPPPAPGNTPPPAAAPAGPVTPAAEPAAPPVEPVAPATAAAPAAAETPTPAAAAVQQEKQSGGCLWGIVGFFVVGLLLLCAGGIAFGIWHFRDKLSGMFAAEGPVTVPVDPGGTVVVPDAPGTPDVPAIPPAGTGKVRVELTWSEPIDLDLEIWDAAGQNMVLRSFNKCGSDQSTGGTPEYFVFDRYGSDNYTRGTYVVSVYFANRERPPTASVTAGLKITLPDGRTVRRSGVVHWERGQDQWHAFSIDAATGAITDLNRYITITTPSSGSSATTPRPSPAAPARPADPSFPVRAPGK